MNSEHNTKCEVTHTGGTLITNQVIKMGRKTKEKNVKPQNVDTQADL